MWEVRIYKFKDEKVEVGLGGNMNKKESGNRILDDNIWDIKVGIIK